MATIPRRRIVRRAVMALAVVVLLGLGLAWVETREPSEIRRSRVLRLGMTATEVEAVMGKHNGGWLRPDPHGGAGAGSTVAGLCFGRSIALRAQFLGWLGLDAATKIEDWPVRVRFDDEGRVDRIERGDDVE